MYPYRIRLRGPWECEPLARFEGESESQNQRTSRSLPAPLQMQIPNRLSAGGLPHFAGRVRFVRQFGYPSRIEPHERLWLTFGGIEGDVEILLNEQLLGKQQSGNSGLEFEVTAILQKRNRLTVNIDCASDQGGIWGEVALEVRCPAFLRNVRMHSTATGPTSELHAEGLVVGAAEQPLELCLMLDNRRIANALVAPTAAGSPFHLTAAGLKVQRGRKGGSTFRLYKVRVDLVNGTNVWYGHEELFEFRDDTLPKKRD